MRPITLPLISDFKKDYKFFWLIYTTPDKLLLNDMQPGVTMFKSTTCNLLYQGYVSQLAEQVQIPDDEFEIESVPQGPVEYQMPKKVKLHDITVTYLDDTLETVYNFHKAWYDAIRCGGEIGINSPYNLCASAKYVPFDETLTMAEYMLFNNSVTEAINTWGSTWSAPALPKMAHVSSMTTYPRIYPTKINRSAANQGSEDISKVTVTYARIPEFKKPHSNIGYYNKLTNNWYSPGKMGF